MKSPKFLLIFIILAALLLSACQAQNAPSAAPEAQRGSVPAASQPSSTYGGKSVESYKAADSGRNVTTTQTDRIVIKNANLSIVVEKPFEALDAIISLASQTGGYVVNSRTYKTTSENGVEVPEAEITIRVPSEKLDEALADLDHFPHVQPGVLALVLIQDVGLGMLDQVHLGPTDIGGHGLR